MRPRSAGPHPEDRANKAVLSSSGRADIGRRADATRKRMIEADSVCSPRCFGRSDRSRIGQQVEGHAGFKSCCPDFFQKRALRRARRRAFLLWGPVMVQREWEE